MCCQSPAGSFFEIHGKMTRVGGGVAGSSHKRDPLTAAEMQEIRECVDARHARRERGNNFMLSVGKWVLIILCCPCILLYHLCFVQESAEPALTEEEEEEWITRALSLDSPLFATRAEVAICLLEDVLTVRGSWYPYCGADSGDYDAQLGRCCEIQGRFPVYTV